MTLRRFLRFRLRTMFMLCTLVGVTLAFYLIPAQRQRCAAAALTIRGASVYYAHELDEQGEVPSILYVCTTGPRAPEPCRWHQRWTGCDLTSRVKVVMLCEFDGRDGDLVHLRSFPHLEELDAGWSGLVTDDGLRHVSRMRQLRRLNLIRTSVTDAGLAHLSSLGRLETLCLRGTQVSDEGLQHLIGLKNLRDLDLDETQVTGAGLQTLATLSKLEYLSLGEINVTHEDIAALERALPNCRVDWDGAEPTPAALGGFF